MTASLGMSPAAEDGGAGDARDAGRAAGGAAASELSPERTPTNEAPSMPLLSGTLQQYKSFIFKWRHYNYLFRVLFSFKRMCGTSRCCCWRSSGLSQLGQHALHTRAYYDPQPHTHATTSAVTRSVFYNDEFVWSDLNIISIADQKSSSMFYIKHNTYVWC